MTEERAKEILGDAFVHPTHLSGEVAGSRVEWRGGNVLMLDGHFTPERIRAIMFFVEQAKS